MWRTRALLKMILSVVFGCALVSIGAQLAWIARYLSYWQPQPGGGGFVQIEIFESVFAGLRLAIPMVIVTLLFFREIRRPLFYRWTMVTVALLVTIWHWGWVLENLLQHWPSFDELTLWSLGLGVVVQVLSVFICHLAAGTYLRAALTRQRQTPADASHPRDTT